jgi:selenocysteine lyase/cysteine desulfurase
MRQFPSGPGITERQMRRTYLGHAATTPARPEAAEAMLPYCTEAFGNPPSIYSCGQEAKGTVEEARAKVPEFICARSPEAAFASGGKETDNCALKGLPHDCENNGNAGSVFRIPAPFPRYLARPIIYVKDHMGHQLLTFSCT